MSSVIRSIREPISISKRFTVFPYYGVPGGGANEYYFTVNGTSLYRVEADFGGDNQWVVARDMGKETFINTIDPEIIEYWENENTWSDITVIRSGRARKYQALAVPNGNKAGSDNNGPAWNAGAYTDPSNDFDNCPIYNNQLTGINDPLIMGNSTTTTTEYTQSLPYGTLWAVVDPVIIRYVSGGNTYTRAIVNRVLPS
jgi:hypothetical protein